MSRYLFLLPAFLLILAGCDAASPDTLSSDGPDAEARAVDGRDLKPDADGLAWARSRTGVDQTVSDLVDVIAEAPPSIITVFDHAANAETVGLDLRPNQVVFFGNPILGTPIMQANQTAGIDLPQKIHVYENAVGQRFATYNTTEYLADRHGVGDVETLPTIAGALETFTEAVTIGNVKQIDSSVIEGRGLVTVESDFSVDATITNLEAIIGGNPALGVAFKLDHQANAASVGLDLRPTTLLVFGNPALGTPLMQAEPTIGIDLPQKMLVWEDADGQVYLTYNDPFYIAERHGLEGQDDRLTTIAGALANIATMATTN